MEGAVSRLEQKKAEALLIEMAEAGEAEGVKAAPAAGARTEESDASGRTPLLLALLGGHVAVARALVGAGAGPGAQDDRDGSAWLVTGFTGVTGGVEMMRTVLPPEPDQTLRNRFGGTALIPAAERGHVPYVRGRVAGGVDGGGPRQRPRGGARSSRR
ncbi:Ankyrin repeat protein [Streptomyces griseus]|uniref:Ankyrin repeat protein n=1 Tax=Streptomyces griseus TaxID=1911 RepID=A0A380ML82_STRGR|nr:Ankyrin repeat protein [Streptomyces griseus]